MTVTPLHPSRRKPPENRGEPLNAEQVAKQLMGGHVSESWVRRNVPNKIRLGHSTVIWYEDDVRDWMLEQREAS